MKYKSTRGGTPSLRFKETVKMGLADDGGLIIPEEIPVLNMSKINGFSSLSYQDVAFEIMKLFVDDITNDLLRNIIDKSYVSFDNKKIIPLIKKGGLYIAELFHGPTLSFKDLALQFLGNLLKQITEDEHRALNVLGATSGDTGSAAIYGIKGAMNINIFMLHPEKRISIVQDLQMTTVMDNNVYNLSVDGTFDDCQFIVKSIFSDVDFKKNFNLIAVNSINWARILAQIVHYFYIYSRIISEIGYTKINIVVPTGNFGNILAGYMAKRMGMPVNKLLIATNENNILTRFINNGEYAVSDVKKTFSPAMDIQVASNFERYLYYLYDESSEKIISIMDGLNRDKRILFDEVILEKARSDFSSYSTNNEDSLSMIDSFYKKYGYILDPHTACGVNSTYHADDLSNYPTVCMATAHPSKFSNTVQSACGEEPDTPYHIKQLFDMERKVYSVDRNIDVIKDFICKRFS